MPDESISQRHWKRGQISLATIDEISRERLDNDTPALILGSPPALAVHESIRHEGAYAKWQRECDGPYTVTHIPTGMRIAGFLSVFAAMEFAEQAMELPAPWQEGRLGEAPAALLAWGEALGEVYKKISG